ncbi:MAG: hypothetical protein FWD74_03975 [Actinomycetia bacterium]|nr:hypothetical protein [Actinomycetes bacterium]
MTLSGKSTGSASSSGDPSATERPTTVTAAFYSVCAQVAFMLIMAVLTFGAGSYIREQITKANTDAKDQTKLPYDLTKHSMASYVHSYQLSLLVSTIVFGVIFIVLGIFAWRGVNWTRWVLIIFQVFPSESPLRVLGFGGDAPMGVKASTVLSGVASIAVIALLLVRDSNAYYRAKRMAVVGDPTVRPVGLRAMFAPRPPAPRPGERGGRAAAGSTTRREPAARREPASKPARKPIEAPPAPPRDAGPSATVTPSPAPPRGKAKIRVTPADPSTANPTSTPRSKSKGR